MSLFFRAKVSCIFLTFILTNSIRATKLRKSVRSASYLTSQPRPFSPPQWSDLSIFQSGPGYSSIFFPIESPYSVPFQWVGNSGIFQPAPDPVSLVGIPIFRWEFLSIFQPSPTQYLDHKWVCPRCFTPHPSIFPTRRGQVTCPTSK